MINLKKQKKPQSFKNKKYPPKRIPTNILKKLERIGEGQGWRRGLDKCLTVYEMIERDPSILLQKELEHFTNMVQVFAPDNHFEHFNKSNMSAVLFKFIKTGHVDHNLLNNRPEKTIDSFEKNKGKDDKR